MSNAAISCFAIFIARDHTTVAVGSGRPYLSPRVSRYRSEIHSLRARIGVLREQLDDLDRARRLGAYAHSSSGRFGYALGRWIARLIGRLRRDDAEELERLRQRVEKLERLLEDAGTHRDA